MLTGPCTCGAIRYRLDAEPSDGGYCHCTICRRTAGASVMALRPYRAKALSSPRGLARIGDRLISDNAGSAGIAVRNSP
jgi:hypothetical protein